MTPKGWKQKIIKDMKMAGVYAPQFDQTIIELANVESRYESAMEDWKKEGCPLWFDRISDRGATNKCRHPALDVLSDLEKQALAMRQQLGLTPAAMKKIDGAKVKDTKKNSSPLQYLLTGDQEKRLKS